MKLIVSLFTLLLTLNVFAGSGVGAVTLVLEQNEVEKLEEGLRAKGFTLSKIEDVFAQKGVAPRCPCTSLNLTFTRVSGGKAEDKKFNVYTQGFGTNLTVSIKPEK